MIDIILNTSDIFLFKNLFKEFLGLVEQKILFYQNSSYIIYTSKI